MKKKLLIYLLSAMVLSTTAMVSKPMSVYAYTQDELSAFFKYSQSLIDQGYSKSEIEKYIETILMVQSQMQWNYYHRLLPMVL